MPTPRRVVATTAARRPYRARPSTLARRRRKGRPREVDLARRALKAMGALPPWHTYVVTDIQPGERRAATRLDVVFAEQRALGLPVYGARRSVVFSGTRTYVTGRPWSVTPPSSLVPIVTAEQAALTAALDLTGRERAYETQLVAAGSGPERSSAVLLERDARAALHLCVFGRRAGRLAWVVRLTMSDGDAFEVVVDATTRRLLRRRPLADHATTSACLRVDTLAGGVAAPATVTLPFETAWVDSPGRHFECLNGNDTITPPRPNATGVFCSSTPETFNDLATHAVALANAGFERLAALGAVLPRRVAIKVMETGRQNVGDVALAIPSLESPRLHFTFKTPSWRHAVSDPGVVLHEMAHLVLCAAIGGGNVVAPFEPSGQSAAVNEGLADFLGLTLWNAVRRDAGIGGPDVTSFAAWLFGTQGRDYTTFLGPGAPLPPSGSTPHARGQALCVALLRTRDAVQASIGAAAADTTLWQTLIEALRVMPHEDSLPDFGCAAGALLLRMPSPHNATLRSELQRVGLPTSCSHLVLI